MTILPSDTGRRVAFFDFDGTLATRDSLWPFLNLVAGNRKCTIAFFCALYDYVFSPPGCDRRTYVKGRLLHRLLQGRRLQDIEPAIHKMRTWPRWKRRMVDALRRHHEQGHIVVVATGGLDLYVKEMLRGLPVDEVLSTRMEIVGDVLTGRMVGGNCVRREKADLVALYLKRNGPFAESWAYGNAPHDLPMMELTTHRVIV